MTNIINGYSFPRFRILDVNDNLIEEIDFQQTNAEGGILEEYSTEDISHVLEKDKEIVKVYRSGKVRISFTLHYSQYIKKKDALKVWSIYEYETLGYKIILIPHVDVLNRQFRVSWSGDNLQLAMGKGGVGMITNKLVVVKWNTKKLEKPNWLDIDDLNIIFTDMCVV